MERRSFLKTTLAAFPLAALQQLSLPAVAGRAQFVATGEDRFGERRGLGFSSIRYKVATEDTGGGLFLIEHRNLTKGGGPPRHLHYDQEEWFYVLEGEVLIEGWTGARAAESRRFDPRATKGSTCVGICS